MNSKITYKNFYQFTVYEKSLKMTAPVVTQVVWTNLPMLVALGSPTEECKKVMDTMIRLYEHGRTDERERIQALIGANNENNQ